MGTIGITLKLFVYGQQNPNPEKWSEWQPTELVFAENADQAAQLVSEHGDVTASDMTEVCVDKPCVLLYTPGRVSDI